MNHLVAVADLAHAFPESPLAAQARDQLGAPRAPNLPTGSADAPPILPLKGSKDAIGWVAACAKAGRPPPLPPGLTEELLSLSFEYLGPRGETVVSEAAIAGLRPDNALDLFLRARPHIDRSAATRELCQRSAAQVACHFAALARHVRDLSEVEAACLAETIADGIPRASPEACTPALLRFLLSRHALSTLAPQDVLRFAERCNDKTLFDQTCEALASWAGLGQ